MLAALLREMRRHILSAISGSAPAPVTRLAATLAGTFVADLSSPLAPHQIADSTEHGDDREGAADQDPGQCLMRQVREVSQLVGHSLPRPGAASAEGLLNRLGQ